MHKGTVIVQDTGTVMEAARLVRVLRSGCKVWPGWRGRGNDSRKDGRLGRPRGAPATAMTLLLRLATSRIGAC